MPTDETPEPAAQQRLDDAPLRSAVIVNPHRVEGLDELRRTIEHELAEAGWPEPAWFETTAEDPGTGQARAAVAGGADVVFVAGGDGTVRACIEGLAGTDAALADRIDSIRRLAGPAVVPSGGVDGDYETRIESVVRENASLEMRAGRFRFAQEQLDRALAREPNDARALLYQGDLHRLRSQRTRQTDRLAFCHGSQEKQLVFENLLVICQQRGLRKPRS